MLAKGLNTPTGKFELKSAVIEQHPEWGLDPLPTYKEPPGRCGPGGITPLYSPPDHEYRGPSTAVCIRFRETVPCSLTQQRI